MLLAIFITAAESIHPANGIVNVCPIRIPFYRVKIPSTMMDAVSEIHQIIPRVSFLFLNPLFHKKKKMYKSI